MRDGPSTSISMFNDISKKRTKTVEDNSRLAYPSSTTPERVREHRERQQAISQCLMTAMRAGPSARVLKDDLSFSLSPQHRDYKTRNILSLEERVRVIREYERNPVYQRISEQFNCSPKQIKNIISNKGTILHLYTNSETDAVPKREVERQQKILFLGKVLYEYVLRAVYHDVTINVGTVRQKALQVKEAIAIENFYPNAAWIQNFKLSYHIEDFDLRTLKSSISFNEPKEASFNSMDIIDYVGRREKLEEQQMNTKRPQEKKKRKYEATLDEMENQNDDYGEPTVTYVCDDDDDDHGANHNMNVNASRRNDHSNLGDDDDMDSGMEQSNHNYNNWSYTNTMNGMNMNDDNSNTASSIKTAKTKSATISHDEIGSAEQALQHLKLLEDYAMLAGNYRAIGLITQLEAAFKRPPEDTDFE